MRVFYDYSSPTRASLGLGTYALRPQRDIAHGERASCKTLASRKAERTNRQHERERARGRPANVGAARIAFRRPHEPRKGGRVGIGAAAAWNKKSSTSKPLRAPRPRIRATPPSHDAAFAWHGLRLAGARAPLPPARSVQVTQACRDCPGQVLSRRMLGAGGPSPFVPDGPPGRADKSANPGVTT